MHKGVEELRARFASLAGPPDAAPDVAIDLIKAAFLIARIAYPDLIESPYHAFLDDMADRVAKAVHPNSSIADILSHQNRIFFKEAAFKGNEDNYYDPDNSYINRVLDRRLGIPISLSLIYMEVGRRAGLSMEGIGLPGHFILRFIHPSGKVFIDPYNGGEVLTEAECRRRVSRQLGPQRPFQKKWLAPIGPKRMIARMLKNLTAIYHHLGRDLHELELLHWILLMTPDDPDERKRRGLIYEAIGGFDAAIQDLEHYLRLSPHAADRSIIEEKIRRMQKNKPLLH